MNATHFPPGHWRLTLSLNLWCTMSHETITKIPWRSGFWLSSRLIDRYTVYFIHPVREIKSAHSMHKLHKLLIVKPLRWCLEDINSVAVSPMMCAGWIHSNGINEEINPNKSIFVFLHTCPWTLKTQIPVLYCQYSCSIGVVDRMQMWSLKTEQGQGTNNSL